MERLAADPMASVPKACHGWRETMEAYRFLGNDSVDWRDILAPHWQQTQQRMQAQPVVLRLQDTTELDFNGQGAIGLGPLSYEAQRGMNLTRPMPSHRNASRLACWTRGCGHARSGTNLASAVGQRYLLTRVRQPAKPSLNEVLRPIARLGGFLGRKGNDDPGANTIWLGCKPK